MSKPFEYVKQNYQVPAEIGRRVEICGRPGTIVADRGHYIGVNFDDCGPGDIRNAHPAADVKYLGMAKPRKMTRSQQRYRDYLEVSDSFQSFKHYLQYKTGKGGQE